MLVGLFCVEAHGFPKIRSSIESEPCRHYPNHVISLAVEAYRPIQNGLFSPISPLPKSIAQNHNVVFIWTIFFG